MLKKLLLGLGLGLGVGVLLVAGFILVLNIWLEPPSLAVQTLAGPFTPAAPTGGAVPDASITIVPAPLTKEGIPAK